MASIIEYGEPNGVMQSANWVQAKGVTQESSWVLESQ